MKRKSKLLAFVLFALFILRGCGTKKTPTLKELEIKRVGMVIKIKPENIEEYKRLHADDNPGVRDLLTEAGIFQ